MAEADFEISQSAIILPFVNRFAPNLIQRPKLRSWIRFYQQNWYPRKSQMVAVPHWNSNYQP